ncbi:YbdK family carboxylate-amine ligase [Andreprevotia chitinilytica]|uniref:YbdK family carboxylate-amine ligase n=1 Tax=Andreprevotia chitinilytica TaxID=396808 RepID=UPI00055134B3|nr:YbdK family carboxylate-amine ligase [Andreprevotia chitinilytica]
MALPSFHSSGVLTMGVELELMLLDPQSHLLTPAALNLLDAMRVRQDQRYVFCPEITQGMIEFNSAVHPRWHSLYDEVTAMRTYLCNLADECGVRIAGGGTHAFQRWQDQDFFPKDRYLALGEKYGYLSKKFTIFGMHVHIGIGDGDTAIQLIRAVSPWVPLLIALAAASPYQDGEDTGFACSRLHVLTPFPYAGRMPAFGDWAEAEGYINRLIDAGVVGSIKDFYWDVRPKPEFGTIEFRIFDTPLTVEIAADLGGLVQLLCARMLYRRNEQPQVYDAYAYNRFQACRYGLVGEMVDPWTGSRRTFIEAAGSLLDELEPFAKELDAREVVDRCRQKLAPGMSQSEAMRQRVGASAGDWGGLLAWQADCFSSGKVE